jgi:predicted nucleic acid-binding protein
MSYLVDTCVLSELTYPRPAAAVVAWLREADPDSLYVSSLTLGEIEKGVERLATGSKKARLRRWAEELCTEWRDRIVSVDEVVAIEWGRLLARAETRGQSLPVIDALIGASAVVRGLTVVTRNESDIARTGAAIFDPWQPS